MATSVFGVDGQQSGAAWHGVRVIAAWNPGFGPIPAMLPTAVCIGTMNWIRFGDSSTAKALVGLSVITISSAPFACWLCPRRVGIRVHQRS